MKRMPRVLSVRQKQQIPRPARFWKTVLLAPWLAGRFVPPPAQAATLAPLVRNLGGGLSRLDEILVDHDVDTAVLAFSHPDRVEFFGAR